RLPLDRPECLASFFPPALPRRLLGERVHGLPGYRLSAFLGAGGFGELYRADPRPGSRARPLVIKQAHLERCRSILEHEEHVCGLVRRHVADDRIVLASVARLDATIPYLAFPCIHGVSLRELLGVLQGNEHPLRPDWLQRRYYPWVRSIFGRL